MHGKPDWTDAQLREELDRALNSARDKWGAFVSDLALAYWDAYKNVDGTLSHISALKKSRQEQADLFWSIILPAVAGGFIGGIVSLKTKAVVDTLDKSTIHFKLGNVGVDTAKTLASDTTKYETRKIEAAVRDAVNSSAWKPTGIDPGQFSETLRNMLAHALVAKQDLLIPKNSDYRNIMMTMYNLPFIWNAPEEKDMALWPRNLLAKVLEIFLWVDWSDHRDVKYWIKRISYMTDKEDGWSKDEYDEELMDLNPILERLTNCGVKATYITQYVEEYAVTVGDSRRTAGGHPFLNVLWIQRLSQYYNNTLLGALLALLTPSGKSPANSPLDLSLRPGSYQLM